ncbi:MAG: low molecular weight phosphotyrosine protein phosphatase [Thermoflexaceae bacterium]|nr:low molecular weight phosphotyrosine protein phosphatase [Thermoflexaceae bacterium]
MIKVLFICHGNICRSPMAEFILKQMVITRGIASHFHIASAATSTEEIWNGIGNPVYPPAREELKKHGITCNGKRAVQVTPQDYDTYDYLIAMDTNNLRNLSRIIGADTDGKVSLLLDYTERKGQSIADPWYSGNFELTYRDIVEGCTGFLKYLQQNKKI